MSYYSAKNRRGLLRLEADVVVVGSGAGGAVVATELALAGHRVVVLEEGPRVTADEHGAMRASESLRHVWRDGGMTVAFGVDGSPSINVTMGKVVGGSSMVTGGVCFRTPETVLDTWCREHGLSDYTPADLDEAFSHVEKAIHVEEVPEAMRSRGVHLYAQGHEAVTGKKLLPISRNTDGCKGCGRCNFGCPEKAKLSVDLSYLPRAVNAGAEVWSHCRALKVLRKGRRAIGVEGQTLGDDGTTPGRFVVRAKRVVLACGAWHTPGLLARSGLNRRGLRRHAHLGRHMTLHPGFRMMARFKDEVLGWKGALQSAWSDSFEGQGVTTMALFIPPSVIAATLPGIGNRHVANARQVPNMAMFGGIIHDEGGGVLRNGPGGQPIATYAMSRKDKATIPAVLRALAEPFFAAGAEEVFPPILGLEHGYDADAWANLDLAGIAPSRFEVSSQHPLGSARMSAEARDGVVDPDGKVWDLDELYVADGSIVPTSLGVNPQLTIMSLATRLAWRMAERPLPNR